MEKKIDQILAILNAATIEETAREVNEPVVEAVVESQAKPVKKEKAVKKESKKKKAEKIK